MKKTNQKPFARVIAKKIDVESIYKQMQQVLAQRKALQEKQDELWKVIKRNHCNRSSQMDSITNGIGKCTHKLNGLISNLCQYRKTHKAMGLANRYLQGEIGRINKIIQHQQNAVNKVERGWSVLVRDTGVTHTDTSQLRRYIKLKQEQVAKLQKWQQVVQRYAA